MIAVDFTSNYILYQSWKQCKHSPEHDNGFTIGGNLFQRDVPGEVKAGTKVISDSNPWHTRISQGVYCRAQWLMGRASDWFESWLWC